MVRQEGVTSRGLSRGKVCEVDSHSIVQRLASSRKEK